MPNSPVSRMQTFLHGLQDRICAALEDVDREARFSEDSWQRPEGGGGRSRVLKQGGVFEQAGVGFSRVQGERMPPSATAQRPELAGRSWSALGVSLVVAVLVAQKVIRDSFTRGASGTPRLKPGIDSASTSSGYAA